MNKHETSIKLASALTGYLRGKIAEFSENEHADVSFSKLGLDSLGHVELSAIIEDTIGMSVEPDIAFNFPTLNALVEQALILKYEMADEKPQTQSERELA